LLKDQKFGYRFENNFVGDHQNNADAANNFDILAVSLSVLRNILIDQNYFSVFN